MLGMFESTLVSQSIWIHDEKVIRREIHTEVRGQF